MTCIVSDFFCVASDLDNIAKIRFFANEIGYLHKSKSKVNMKEQVLQAMREAGKPVSAGEVTKALGADRKEVDKAFAELKKEGAIVSPVRCKWEPAAK